MPPFFRPHLQKKQHRRDGLTLIVNYVGEGHCPSRTVRITERMVLCTLRDLVSVCFYAILRRYREGHCPSPTS